VDIVHLRIVSGDIQARIEGGQAASLVESAEIAAMILNLVPRRSSKVDPFVELITVRTGANARAEGRIHAIQQC
jgi:hypothetical protein